MLDVGLDVLSTDRPDVAWHALIDEEVVELLEVRDVRSVDGRVGPAAGPQMAAIRLDRLVDRVGGL